jgi:hypothetical protein
MEEKITSVKVMNIAGKIILNEEIYNNNSRIDLSNLPKGLYLLEICAGEKLYHQKIIKE